MGLEDLVFGTVCSTILNMELLPNLNQVCAMIIIEENLRKLHEGKTKKEKLLLFFFRQRIRWSPVNVTRKQRSVNIVVIWDMMLKDVFS